MWCVCYVTMYNTCVAHPLFSTYIIYDLAHYQHLVSQNPSNAISPLKTGTAMAVLVASAFSWYCPRMTRAIRVSLGPGTIWQVDGITCPRMVRVSSVVSIAMTTVSTVCMYISKWHTSSCEVLVLLKPKIEFRYSKCSLHTKWFAPVCSSAANEWTNEQWNAKQVVGNGELVVGMLTVIPSVIFFTTCALICDYIIMETYLQWNELSAQYFHVGGLTITSGHQATSSCVAHVSAEYPDVMSTYSFVLIPAL